MRASLGFTALEPGSCVAAFDPCRQEKRNKTLHEGAGYGTLHTVVRFVAWSHEQSAFPTVYAVIGRFGCSKATANRWLNALEDCYGIERPRASSGGRRA